MKQTEKSVKKKMTSRQLVAIVGVVLLAFLYVITLIAAIVDNSASAQWFRVCLAGTFIIPLLIWIYSWVYGRLTGKAAPGDPAKSETAASQQED